MRGYNPKATDLFDSLSSSEREDLRWMLECGVTNEDAAVLLADGLAEESKPLDGFDILFTPSALRDLECFGTTDIRKRLDVILHNLNSASHIESFVDLQGGIGRLHRAGPFRVVSANQNVNGKTVVVAIAPAGISPTTGVWRYFDQSKAEDLLESSSLYFCRLDKLTGDPREGRLPHISTITKRAAFQTTFGNDTVEAVSNSEELLRATSYVCCWTRRQHESYLAWKHYCPSGGGFAIRTTWRQLAHLHCALKKNDDQVFCRAVGYLDPSADDLPNHEHGEQVFWKAKWFSDETEIRLAVFRWKSGAVQELLAQRNEWSVGEKIRLDVEQLIQHIVVNPFASDSQKETIIEGIKKFQPHLADRILESAIVHADLKNN